MPDESGDYLLVNVHGERLIADKPTSSVSRSMLQFLVESTASIAIGTAVMFYLGHVYYQNFFGSFGTPSAFPPMGTADYITKAFDLITAPLVQILVVIWITTFAVTLEADAQISRIQVMHNSITDINRKLGVSEWELRSKTKTIRKLAKQLKSKDKRVYLQYMKYNSEALDHHTNWAHWLLRIFPYHVSWHGVLGGILLNLYIFLTLLVMVITAIRIDAALADG